MALHVVIAFGVLFSLFWLIAGYMADPAKDKQQGGILLGLNHTIERRYGKYLVEVDGIQFVEQRKLDAALGEQDELLQLLERWENSYYNPSREPVFREQDLAAQTRVILDAKRKRKRAS